MVPIGNYQFLNNSLSENISWRKSLLQIQQSLQYALRQNQPKYNLTYPNVYGFYKFCYHRYVCIVCLSYYNAVWSFLTQIKWFPLGWVVLFYLLKTGWSLVKYVDFTHSIIKQCTQNHSHLKLDNSLHFNEFLLLQNAGRRVRNYSN